MEPADRLGMAPRVAGTPYPLWSKLVRVVFAFACLVPAAIPFALICLVLLPFRATRVRVGNWMGKRCGAWIYWVLGISHTVVGEPLEGQEPALYVCNHAATVDFWMAIQLCPSPGSGTVKKEFAWVPIIGQMYWLSGHLMITRGNRKKAISAMASVAKMVAESKMSIWILPEGTRSRSGRLQPFKKGFAHMALATRLPIVPVVVHDADLIWNRANVIRPGDFIVEVLPRIPTTSWSIDTLDEHVQQIHEVFVEHLGSRQLPTG